MHPLVSLDTHVGIPTRTDTLPTQDYTTHVHFGTQLAPIPTFAYNTFVLPCSDAARLWYNRSASEQVPESKIGVDAYSMAKRHRVICKAHEDRACP